MKKQKMYCGIDVSSETLDICYQTIEGEKQHKQVKNNKVGFQTIVKLCGKSHHYVMESTGVYHTSLMFYLHEHGLVFSVINALQIKRYIQMHLERNKTDKKDAKRICEYGIDRTPEPTQMPDKDFFECRTINNAIHDLTKDITKLSNQIHSLKRAPYFTDEVLNTYKSILTKLKKEKTKLENTLNAKLKAWQPELLELVQSVKGIGKRAASELIIYTKGFKDIENYKQLISYAGLSPVEFTSGSSIKGRVRICKQGGKQLRHILYMGALNAKSTNRACRELFERLVIKGKNKKSAIIAVCNKLLKQVFGVVKTRTKYQDNYQPNFN
jgi:transposase